MGIFRLTDPPGLGLVKKCKKSGFHPHKSEKPIYTVSCFYFLGDHSEWSC